MMRTAELFLWLKSPFIFLHLFHSLLSFPHATDETLLAKFKQQHQGNKYFVPTPVMEPAFVIQHFAGKVKYQVKVRMTSRGGITHIAKIDRFQFSYIGPDSGILQCP